MYLASRTWYLIVANMCGQEILIKSCCNNINSNATYYSIVKSNNCEDLIRNLQANN